MTDYGPVRKALAYSLEHAPEGTLTDADAAVKTLAKRYADLIDHAIGTEDEAARLAELGPKLLAALGALRLTPASRGARGGVSGGVVVNTVTALDELRERRGRRAGSD